MFNQSKFNSKRLDKGMTQPSNVKKDRGSLELERRKQYETTISNDPILKLAGVATQQERKFDLKQVTTFIEVIYDILYIYGYSDIDSLTPDRSKILKEKTIRDKLKLRNLILEFVFKTGFGSWKDLFKYKINAFFSFIMEQELPPAPAGLDKFVNLINPSFLVFGRAKRFIKRLLLDEGKKKSFAQSIAQSKKAAPAVASSVVSEAEYKTFVQLTSPREDIPERTIFDGVFEHVINRNTLKYQLRRTVREVFKHKICKYSDLCKPFVPSVSSQYNWDRNSLGAVGAFLMNIKLHREVEPYTGFDWVDGVMNTRLPTTPNPIREEKSLIKKRIGQVYLSGELTELYGKCGIEDQKKIDEDLNHFVKDTLGLLYDGEELCELWKTRIYPLLIKEALEEEPRTIVIGLPEPLKVRCITAGPPLTQTALKPMQKWLWKTLKNESVFQLIGTPVTKEIVNNMMGKLRPGEVFVSGDYKASTDNLHSWVSECLLDELITMFRENIEKDEDALSAEMIDDLEVLMKRALTGHLILDPTFNDDYRAGELIRDENFHPQREGQLMGSIISFPFLCLANAAFCRYAMEISERKNLKVVDRWIDGYEKCRLVVNGDDCLFPGRKSHFVTEGGENFRIPSIFDIWTAVTSRGGLESSVGKTFVSKKFMTINSVQYEYKNEPSNWEAGSGFESDVTFSELKYVNMGLVYAQKKDGTRGKHFFALSSVHEDLHRTCPPEYFQRATNLFIKNAKKRKFRQVNLKDKKGNDILDEIPHPDGLDIKVYVNRYKLVEEFFYSIKNAKVPWYLPSWLGGLGLRNPDEKSWDKSSEFRRLRKFANIMKNNIEDFKPRNFANFAKWQFHKLVSKNLQEFEFLSNQNFRLVSHDDTERELSEEYQKLYGLMVVERFLIDGVSPGPPKYDKAGVPIVGKHFERIVHVTKDSEEREFYMETFLHNTKLWRRLYEKHDNTNYGMIDVSDLQSETKDFNLSCFDVRL